MEIQRIGRFIAAQRTAKGMTQRELGERLQVSAKAVSKWETGKGLPDPSSWLALSELLGVGVEELLSGARSQKERDAVIVDATMYVQNREKRRYLWPLIAVIALAVFLSGALAYRAVAAALDTTRIRYDGRDYVQSSLSFLDLQNHELLLESVVDTGVRVKGMEVYDDPDNPYASTLLLLKPAVGSFLVYTLQGGP